jgi:hypothetical protein
LRTLLEGYPLPHFDSVTEGTWTAETVGTGTLSVLAGGAYADSSSALSVTGKQFVTRYMWLPTSNVSTGNYFGLAWSAGTPSNCFAVQGAGFNTAFNLAGSVTQMVSNSYTDMSAFVSAYNRAPALNNAGWIVYCGPSNTLGYTYTGHIAITFPTSTTLTLTPMMGNSSSTDNSVIRRSFYIRVVS